MWDFPRYTSKERAFSFSQGTSETIGARAEARAGARTGTGSWASRTALKIHYKSSSEYLGTLVAARGVLARSFALDGPAGWSDNLSPDSEGGEKSEGVMKGATEGAAERRSRQERLRPQTQIILELISSKIHFQTGWLTHWVWKN